MNDLIAAIEEWAEERGIFAHSSPLDQMEKTLEEVDELTDAIWRQDVDNAVANATVTSDDLKDAIGDITVTLIIQAKMQGFSFQECLMHAWNEIKDRKGHMINGQFVKEE